MVALAERIASPPSLTTGTLADYAVFEADTPGLAFRPAQVAAEHAATLPTVGLTALPLLRTGAFRRGEVVLVIGATGGVGGALVPLLAATGAHVIATASAVDDHYVRGLGAADIVDHRSTDTVEETLCRHPAGVDAVGGFVARPVFEEYAEKYADYFVMRRENGVIELRMHTGGGPATFNFAVHNAWGQTSLEVGCQAAMAGSRCDQAIARSWTLLVFRQPCRMPTRRLPTWRRAALWLTSRALS